MKIDMNLGDTQIILDKCREHNLSLHQTAYILATAYWETGRTMEPVIEAFWLSESWRRRNLRYYPYYGRGYVQLTWHRNYLFAGRELGIDFVENPERLLEPAIAAEILVRGSMEGWFTGRRLGQYVNETLKDYRGARRVINGVDKRDAIATIALAYQGHLASQAFSPKNKTPSILTRILSKLKEALSNAK